MGGPLRGRGGRDHRGVCKIVICVLIHQWMKLRREHLGRRTWVPGGPLMVVFLDLPPGSPYRSALNSATWKHGDEIEHAAVCGDETESELVSFN